MCSDVSLKKIFFTNLEAINCKPFYLLQEFSSFIITNSSGRMCVSEALQQLAEQITEMEQSYPASLLIICGEQSKTAKIQTACDMSHWGQ